MLHTVLLSLHLEEELGDAEAELNDYTRTSLDELRPFHYLLFLKGQTGGWDLHMWLASLPDGYTAQLALMGWFLTLTAKMTGFTIPGVGMVPGGRIQMDRPEMAQHIEDMETVADAMNIEKDWNRPQVRLFMSWSCLTTPLSPVRHPQGDVSRPQEDVLRIQEQQVSDGRGAALDEFSGT